MTHPFLFKNEPLLNFENGEVRSLLERELMRVRSALGRTYYPIINGKKVTSGDVFVRENPSKKDEVLGKIVMTNTTHADMAVASATIGQRSWRDVSIKDRAEILLNAARLMREKRYFFIALMMLEVGKDRQEADGEFAEAVDFLEYYAERAPWIIEIAQDSILNPRGEENTLIAIPKGVGVSIQPWNFPLAISMGPMVAALVTGNAVIYKPSRESSIIGFHLTQVLHEAGIPKGVLHYLPGSGRTVGEHLIKHKDVQFIAFTGSLEVGMAIKQEVASRKTAIAAMELGGKGVMYIDSDADLNKAVIAVTDSAFGFQGQKCSACSRLLVHEDIYDKFISRLINRIVSLDIDSPENDSVQMGPVVSSGAFAQIQEYIEIAEEEGTILVQGKIPSNIEGRGYFIPPTLVGEISHDSRIAQEEIFGPVLAVFRVKDLDEAIELANGTQYGLTAGIFSRNDAHKKQFVREVEAGNIYINQKITGAIVGRQPFAGLKMSGDGTKAGGPFYLLQFVDWKSVSEDTTCFGYALNTEQ